MLKETLIAFGIKNLRQLKTSRYFQEETTRNNQKHSHRNNELCARTSFQRTYRKIIRALGRRMQIDIT